MARKSATASTTSSSKALKLSALREEYASLRRESISAIGYRIQIVTFTFAALSVIVVGLMTRNAPDKVTAATLLLVVPQIAKASLLMWLGEYHRSVRAGTYLREIEEKINKLVGKGTLGWESQLGAGKYHMSYPYLATAFLILGAGYVASALGISLLPSACKEPRDSITVGWQVLTLLVVYVVVLEVAFFAFFYSKWRSIRESKL